MNTKEIQGKIVERFNHLKEKVQVVSLKNRIAVKFDKQAIKDNFLLVVSEVQALFEKLNQNVASKKDQLNEMMVE